MSEQHERERSARSTVHPTPVVPVVEYSSPPPHNRNASRALLFALLSFIPFVPGILAIRYGRRGLSDADADPKLNGRVAARAGTIIGVVSVTVWTVLSILAVPAMVHARRQAIRVQCMSQLRQMGMAAMMYANGNRGVFPAQH